MGKEEEDEDEAFVPKKKVSPKKASFARLRQSFTYQECAVAATGITFGTCGCACTPLCHWFNITLMIELLKGGEEALSATARIIPLLFGICGTSAICMTGLVFSFRTLNKSQEAKYKSRAFHALMRQDIAWYDMQDIQALAIKVSMDCTDAAAFYGDPAANTWLAFCASIFGFVMGFYRGYALCACCLATLPPMIIGLGKAAQAAVEVATESQVHFDQAASLVEETLSAIRTVVSLGHERHTLKEFETIMERVRKQAVRGSFRKGLMLGAGWHAIAWQFALCTFAGYMFKLYDVVNPMYGEVYSAADIIIIFLAVFNTALQLGVVPPGLNAMNKALVASKNCFDLEDSRPQVARDPPKYPEKRKECKSIETITYDEIHFGYPARPENKILKGATLTIHCGQKVAFVGESGCGKSTLFALLCRFYDPEIGQVLINGEDMKTYSISSLRTLIGYVGQEPVLFGGTIRDNLQFVAPHASKDDILLALDKAGCWFMSKLPDGIETDVGVGGSMFSGGQRQRIAIARVLVKKPTTMMLDEATSALDNTSEQAIMQMLDEYSKSLGGKLTTLSIAHRLSTVMGSDIIYFFEHGRVLEYGSHVQLVAKQGAYYRMVEGQAQTKEDESSESEDEEGNDKTASKSKKDELKQIEKVAENQRTAKIGDGEAPYKAPMSRVLEFCRPERKWFVPACTAAFFTGCTYPFFGSGTVRSVVGFMEPDKADMTRTIMILIGMYVGLGVVVQLGHVFQYGCMGIIGEAMTKRLRVQMLKAIMRQGIGFHDDPANSPSTLGFKLRQLPSRMTALNDAVASNFAVIGSLSGGVLFGLVRDWRVSLIITSSIPLMTALQAAQEAVIKGATSAAGSKKGAASQKIMSATVQNARTVQTLCIEDVFETQYVKLLEPPSCTFKEQMALLSSALLYGLAASTMFAMITFCYWVISRLLVYHNADYIATQEALLCAVWGAAGIGAAAVAVGDANAARLACQDMFAILDTESEINGLEPKGSTPTASDFGAGNIEFQNVVFAYPFRSEVTVLKGMSFSVPAGASIALVGPSGGGKSTILALIQRFYDPVQGRVKVGKDKMPLTTINIRWWRQQIGFVGQEPVLFNTTVLQNVLYGKRDGVEVPMEKLEEYKKMSACGFIDGPTCNGWETEVGPRGGRLSGGQKQRVAICRALVRDPPLLLLDEATSALDNESERIVSQALETARAGRTSFAIAHRLSTVEECDIILVCAEGIVAEYGDDAQLMIMEGIYARLQGILGKTTYACA